MGDFAALSDFLTSLTEGLAPAVDAGEFSLQLQVFRERFLHHLEYKGPNQASRQTVESLRVRHKDQDVQLDAEPDKRLALQLSAALNLDEVQCVHCLIEAHDQRGSFTAETAAGVYLSERQAAARCLMRLLSEAVQQVVNPQEPGRHPFGTLLHEYVMGLLAERAAPAAAGQRGAPVLVTRLVEVLKDTSLEVHPSSDLKQVRDEAGLPVSRAALLQLERRMVAKSLLYCLVLDQRAGPAATSSLMDLLAAHAARVKPGAVQDSVHQELAGLLLLCLVLALIPQEERGTQEQEELRTLLAAADLKAKVFPPGSRAPGGPQTPAPAAQGLLASIPGASAVLRMCWGVLEASISTQGPQIDEGKKLLLEASGNATFTHLKKIVQNCLAVPDDASHQEVVVGCAYRLLGQALQADSKLDNPMQKALVDRLMMCVKRVGGGGIAFSPLAVEDPAAQSDHLGSVLGLLATVFGVAPRLWLSADAGDSQRLVESLITRTVTHDAMKVSPEVRIPFFEMMTALAAGEYGVAMVLRQFAEMARQPAFEVLTWRKLFATVVEYCVRYNTVLEELARTGGGGVPALMLRGHEERLMNTYEAGILVAQLDLFRQVVEAGSLPDVRNFLEGLEREVAHLLSGYSLTEPLFQLMCHPVPNTVKASLDEVLCGIAHRFSDTAGPRLLDRLVQCAAVAAGMPMVPGVPRLDMVTQLNEIEARKEEYPETLAFVNLLNSLTAAALLRDAKSRQALGMAAGTAATSANSSGVGLSHFTGFVVQHVLGQLWHRGYRFPAQKWELAAVSLQHLQLMLEVASRSGSAPAAPTEPQAPGWAVMHDILSSGASLQALLHVLGPGYEEINTEALLPAPDVDTTGPGMTAAAAAEHAAAARSTAKDTVSSRQAAVLAALRVANKVLQLDQQFIADTGRAMPGPPYQSLDQLLLTSFGGRAGGSAAMAGAVLGAMGLAPGSTQLLAKLLQYVCYQDSEDIQVEALRLAVELSARHPNLVEMLPAGSDADSDNSVRITLRRGIAVVLRQSLFTPSTCDSLEEAGNLESRGLPQPSAANNEPTCDVRAALVMKLLLANASVSAVPSFTHLLMGYDTEPSMQGLEESFLAPNQEYSCLSVIEKALKFQGHALSITKPQLFSNMLRLLYELAAAPVSSTPILEYLSPKNSKEVMHALLEMLTQPLPHSQHVLEAAASLHQRSWIMRLKAFLLLRLEHAESIQLLLAQLLQPVDETAPGMSAAAAGVAGSTVLAVLQALVDVKLQEPKLADLPADIRRLQSDMSIGDVSIEALLVQPHVQENLDILMRNETGDLLFDLPRLNVLLMQRFEQYLLRSGQPAGGANEAATETIRQTYLYVQQCNAHALLSGAQQAAFEGWNQLVEVVFTRQYNHLAAVLPLDSASLPADAVYVVVMASLQAASSLLSSTANSSTVVPASTAVNVARILLSKLQELGVVNVSLGHASDPLVRVRTPSRCHALLSALITLLKQARRAQPVRVQLYAALLQYLQFCRGSKLSSCAPIVLQAVLQGQSRTPALAITDGSTQEEGMADSDGQPTSASAAALAARLDAAQEAIEKGNAALINTHGATLVEITARDALDATGPQFQQAITMHLLAALVTASADSIQNAAPTSPGTLVGALYQHAMPQALLQVLAGVPVTLLANPSKSARRGIWILGGQLALLLALAQAGPNPQARQLSAQSLFSLQPLQHLTGCRAVDLEPEEPGSLQSRHAAPHTDSLRERLKQLLAPVLRLVLALMGSLPQSSNVRQDARLFVTAHYRAMSRVLQETASSGVSDWRPGEGELEQAELVTSLLSRLVPVWDELGPRVGEGLRAALYRLCTAFCCLNSKSSSPIVRSLHTNGTSGQARANNRAALIARASRVASLRAALARYLRDTVVHAAPPPTANGRTLTDADMNNAAYGGPGVPFRALGRSSHLELDPVTCCPTLLLIRDMAEQACLDAASAVEELQELLGILRAPDVQLDDRTCVQKLLDYGPVGGIAAATAVETAGSAEELQGAAIATFVGGLHARRKLARHYTAMAASQLDGLLGRTLFVLENSLAVIVLHFLRYLPRALPDLASGAPGLANGSTYAAGGSEELLMAAAASSLQVVEVNGQGNAQLLGSPSDLTYLATRLQETCVKAEGLLEAASRLGQTSTQQDGAWGGRPVGLASRHMERLQGVGLMVRTAKSYCARL